MNEWMSMLNDSFGVEESIDYGAGEVTGEDIVKTSFSFVNDERLSHLTETGETDEESIIDLAIENEIVSKRQLNKAVSQNEADEALNRFMDFYMNPDSYPVYEDITLNSNVDNGIDAHITEHNEDYTVCTISGYTPEADHIVVLTTDDGNGIARRVVSYEEKEDGTYDLVLQDVENIDDVIDVLSFSGYGFIDDETQASAGDLGDVAVSASKSEEAIDSKSTKLFEPMTVYAKKFGGTSNAMDVMLSVSYGNSNGKSTFANKVTVDDEDLLSKTKELGEEAEHDNWSASGSITGSIELSNLTIAAEGCVFDGKKDYVEITATSDVIYDLNVEGDFEGSYKICSIPVRIFPNPGVKVAGEKLEWLDDLKPELSVDIGIYLEIGANGELEIKYIIEDASIGVNASKENGVKPIKSNSGNNVTIDGKTTVEAGLRVEADLIVDFLQFNDTLIADPSVYAGAEANAEILDVKEGYEDYLPCVALDVRGPIVKITFAEDEETPLNEILDYLQAEKRKDIFTFDTAPLKKEWHVETDLEYKITKLDGGIENCTHVKKDDLEDLVEEQENQAKDKINNAVEEEKNKMLDKLAQKIDEMIEQWFMENCDD